MRGRMSCRVRSQELLSDCEIQEIWVNLTSTDHVRCRGWFSRARILLPFRTDPHDSSFPLEEKVVITYKDQLKILTSGFPGVSVAKNLPGSAGDTGSVPGLGRSHVQRSNEAREPQLLKPGHPEPLFHNRRSHCSEKLVRAPREEPARQQRPNAFKNKCAIVLKCFIHAHPRTAATRLLCPCDSPGKNTAVGCHALLQRIFSTRGLNLHLLRLLHDRQILDH